MTQETEIKKRLKAAKGQSSLMYQRATKEKWRYLYINESLDDIPTLLKVNEELRGENEAMREVVEAAERVRRANVHINREALVSALDNLKAAK